MRFEDLPTTDFFWTLTTITTHYAGMRMEVEKAIHELGKNNTSNYPNQERDREILQKELQILRKRIMDFGEGLSLLENQYKKEYSIDMESGKEEYDEWLKANGMTIRDTLGRRG